MGGHRTGRKLRRALNGGLSTALAALVAGTAGGPLGCKARALAQPRLPLQVRCNAMETAVQRSMD